MTYLELGVMGNGAYTRGLGRKSNLPHTILVLLEGVRGPVPFIWQFK
jgi:hypothetical protein